MANSSPVRSLDLRLAISVPRSASMTPATGRVWRVTAVGELTEGDPRVDMKPGRACDLSWLHRRVLVAISLDRQHRQSDLRQFGLDVPEPERRVEQPCPVSQPKKAAVRVVMYGRQRARAACRASHASRRGADAGRSSRPRRTRGGRHNRDRARRMARRMEQRDRATVAMAHEHWRIDAQLLQERGQHVPGFTMQVMVPRGCP